MNKLTPSRNKREGYYAGCYSTYISKDSCKTYRKHHRWGAEMFDERKAHVKYAMPYIGVLNRWYMEGRYQKGL
jgi:hypothetical protein